MNRSVLLAARWITSVLLVILAVPAVHTAGLSRVIGAAIVIHAASGHPPIILAFPILVIVMVLLIRP